MTSRKEATTWRSRTVDLSPCAGRASLVLETTCGPRSDCTADGAVWGDPRLEWRAPVTPSVQRLVLLVSVDTVRADRTSLHAGGSPTTTPRLTELAEDAIVFEQAIAPSPWTVPSHASLLTSAGPDVHGARDGVDLPADLPVLAEVLRRNGWSTGGFTDTDADAALPAGEAFYDLGTDPTEVRNRIQDPGVQGDVALLREVLDHRRRGILRRRPVEGRETIADSSTPDDERRLEALRSLGYLGSTP